MVERKTKAKGDGARGAKRPKSADAQARRSEQEESIRNSDSFQKIAGSLWLPSGLSGARTLGIIEEAVDSFVGLKPSDKLESMLAMQMVATHAAMMECMRRAMFPDQTFAGREQTLKHAVRLGGLYARQVEALDKHRGQGQQKITVEHVTVNAGGKAIVGNVGTEASGAAAAAPTAQTPALAYDPAPLAPALDLASHGQRQTAAVRGKADRNGG